MRPIPISRERLRGSRGVVLAAHGLIWLAVLSGTSCGSDDSSTSVSDASTQDGATTDAGLGADGSVGDPGGDGPTDVSKDSGAAENAPDGASDDELVADAVTKDDAANADANAECCVNTPSTADNPPVPAGYMLLPQSEVTPEMTSWAVMILDDPTTYPMFDTVTKTFDAVTVLLRVEWHAPDFQNDAVHRGVTLYVPL